MVDSIVQYLKTPQWRRQQKWRKAIWNGMIRTGLTGMYALPLSRRWIDIHRRRMPLPGLDPAFEGMRVVQISDLHHSPVVSAPYLLQFMHWINEQKPDLVVVTGDLITGGYRYAHKVSTILSHLKSPRGVICTLGNHDYSLYGGKQSMEGRRRANYLEQCLLDRGLIVLRNQALELTHEKAQKPVTIVGLDDEWSGAIDASRAWQQVKDVSQPIICLNHNPANVLDLLDYRWDWMLSGHTHGRQLATSKLGKKLYPGKFRHYTRGHYLVRGRHLYVNRGLSYGQRKFEWCRPEITIFRLEQQRGWGDVGQEIALDTSEG